MQRSQLVLVRVNVGEREGLVWGRRFSESRAQGADEVEDVEGPAASLDLEFFEGTETAVGAANVGGGADFSVVDDGDAASAGILWRRMLQPIRHGGHTSLDCEFWLICRA